MAVERGTTGFEQGVRLYADGLKEFLRRRLGNDADADDALQEILYNLFRTAGDDLSTITNLPAWLYRAARNLLSNIGRRNSAVEDCDYNIMLQILSDTRYDQEALMLRSMFWQQLETALDALPSEQRCAWELSELGGMSIKQISELTGAPQSTVLSRKHYAVAHLRKELRRLYADICC